MYSFAGYQLSGKQIKKATGEDVDAAYLKLHTGLEEATGASNQMNSTEMAKFIKDSRRTASGGYDGSAFDGALGKMGGFSNLESFLDKQQARPEHDDVECDENGKGSAGEMPPSKKAKTEDAEKELWFGLG